MSEVTSASMHDARDAEDRRLLEAGEHQLLVESYYGVILDRCRGRVRDEGSAVDVAAEVVIRLLAELKRRKAYAVPFRVVVHQVTTWKIKEFFTQGRAAVVELDELLIGSHDGGFAAVESDFDLELLFAELPPRDQEIATLRWRKGVEIKEIAAHLDLSRNAVDQSLHRTAVWLRGRSA
jgi:RNA polymerase sigma factor (sigma-70 family)